MKDLLTDYTDRQGKVIDALYEEVNILRDKIRQIVDSEARYQAYRKYRVDRIDARLGLLSHEEREETWRHCHTLMLDVADKAMRKAKTEDPRFTRAYLIVRDLMIEAILRD